MPFPTKTEDSKKAQTLSEQASYKLKAPVFEYSHLAPDAREMRFLLEEILDKIPHSEDTALLLSGGLDSSGLACIMLSKGRKLRSISTSFKGFPMYDETAYVEAIKNKYPALELNFFTPLDIDLVEKMKHLMSIIKQPINFSSGLLFLFMCEKAKELGIKNLIIGHWPDEIMAGYDLFLLARAYDNLKSFKFSDAKINAKEYFYRSRLASNLSVPRVLKDLSLRGVRGALKYFYKTLPTKERKCHSERVAEWYGLNFFMPYLDERIVSLCKSLPAERLVDKGKTKIILREAVSDLLPKETLERRQKFCCPGPDAVWFMRNKDKILALNDRELNREYAKFLKNPGRRYYHQFWLALSRACLREIN